MMRKDHRGPRAPVAERDHCTRPRALTRERRARRPPGGPGGIAQTTNEGLENLATSASWPLASAGICPDCSHKVLPPQVLHATGSCPVTNWDFESPGVR